MNKTRATLLGLGWVLFTPLALAGQPQPDTVEIYAVHDSNREARTVLELRDVLQGLDLRDWVITPTVRIDETQIPHSHPVLTIHTRHLGDRDALLAVFLHEQFHWWVLERDDELRGAVSDFREAFPEVPVGNPTGGRSEYSTYLHLVVCHLELQAVTLLKGEARARKTLSANTHYTWIYDRVLDDPRVGEILARHGFTLS